MPPTFRRIVTGHGPDGRSRIASERTFKRGEIDVMSMPEEPETMFAEIWRMAAVGDTDPPDLSSGMPFAFPPPPGGIAIRMCVLPSDSKRNYARHKDHYAAVGATEGMGEQTERHPGMHKTDTVDYIVILSGRLRLVLEDGEKMLAPGDVVIQRGTKHAWSNPDDEPCVLAAIMIDAKPANR